MSKEDKDLADYLQSVTDALCGHPVRVRAARQGLSPATPAAEMEATHLRKVWEMLDVLSPPEPDDALMDRMFQRARALSESHELDDDELDLVVGAAKEPEVEDMDEKDKNKS